MEILMCLLTIASFSTTGSFGIGEPEWTINPSEQFEYEATSFTCDITNVNCNPLPNNVYIEKYIDDSWQELVCVYFNESYDSIPLPDGYTVEGRLNVIYTDNAFGKVFRVGFDNVTVSDTGLWRCTIKDCDSNSSSSRSEDFGVVTKLEKSGVLIEQPKDIILGIPIEYTCIYERVHPEFDVIWTVHGHNYTKGTPSNAFDGLYYTIKNSINFTFCENRDTTVTCTITKATGLRMSVHNDVRNTNILAPAAVERSSVSSQNPAVTEVVKMECIATGTTRNVQWTRDNIAISAGLFEMNKQEVKGNFTCGETHATLSTLTSIPVQGANCSGVITYDGVYRCEVVAAQGSFDASQLYPLIAEYPPFIAGDSLVAIESTVGSTVEMSCAVECSRPNVLTYSWGTDKGRAGLIQGKPFISINVTNDDFMETFLCVVNNSAGESTKRFRIKNTEYIDAPGELASGPAIAIALLTIGWILTMALLAGYICYVRKYCIRNVDHSNALKNENHDTEFSELCESNIHVYASPNYNSEGTQQAHM